MSKRYSEMMENNGSAASQWSDTSSVGREGAVSCQEGKGMVIYRRPKSRLFLIVALLASFFALQGVCWVDEAKAAAAFQAAGTAVNAQNALAVSWPTHQADDVALLFVETMGTEGEPTLSTPAGFARVVASQATGDTRLTIFGARATSSTMGDVTIADSGDHQIAQILTFRGVVSTGNPWSATAGAVKTPASTTFTAPAVTTVVPNELVVVAVSTGNDADSTTAFVNVGSAGGWANGNLTGLAERADYTSSNRGGGGFGVVTGTKATAGLTGTTTGTIATSFVNAMITISLAPQPTVDWSTASQSANEVNGATMTVTAQLSQRSIADATIPFNLSGTATNGADYTITPNPITIAAGSTTGTTTITITGDTLDEPNETAVLTIASPTGASLGTTTVHTATINDDDPTPTVQWTSTAQTSADETAGTTMTVTAQLSAASGQVVTVPFTLTGSATNTTDYTISPASSVTIPAGSTTGSATITIVGDASIEGDETVILTIGASPTNATRAATNFVHTATIYDDDTNATIAGAMTISSVTKNSMTVTVAFAADLNGNNSCSLQAYSDSGRTVPVGSAVTMTRAPASGAGPGTFTANLSALTEGTFYYFRATFTDADGYKPAGARTADGAASTAFGPLMHVSYNTGDTYGTWGAGFNCQTCHTAGTTANIKKVATVVGGSGLTNTKTPIPDVISGRPLSNTTKAGGASAGWATTGATNAVCDVCHARTSVFAYNTADTVAGSVLTNGTPDHPNDLDCIKCHRHSSGFKLNGGCAECHALSETVGSEVYGTYQSATAAPVIFDPNGTALRGENYGGHLLALKTDSLTSLTTKLAWNTQCLKCHDGHYKPPSGGVHILNNPTVGINYANGYIALGGSQTSGSTEAEICWNCHDKAANAVSEWGANTDTNSTATNYNFGTVYTNASKTIQTSKWIGTYWVSANFTYKEGWLNNKPTTGSPVNGAANGGSTHAASVDGVSGVDAVAAIRCTYCHDVHNTANLKSTVAGDVNGKPYLRGSWKGNPYKEDGAPRTGVTYTANNGYGLIPRGGPTYTDYGGYFIDQNTTVNPNSLGWVAGGATGFGGLCELCHGNANNSFTSAEIDSLNKFGNATDAWVGTNGHANSVLGGSGAGAANIFSFADRNSTQPTFGTTVGVSAGNPAMGNVQNTANWVYSFRSVSSRISDGFNVGPYATTEQIPNAGTKWGVTISAADPIDPNYHTFSCSKCHNPHASRLPRLMITNCLDTKNNTWGSAYIVPSTSTTVNGNSPSIDNASMPITQATSAQNCHRVRDPSYANSRGAGWNLVTPW